MRLYLALLVVVVLAPPGCSCESTSGLALRAGTTEVFHGPLYKRTGNVLGQSWYDYTVLDVGRSGGHLVTTIAQRSQSSGFTWHPAPAGCDACTGTIGGIPDSTGSALATSDDTGATWAPLALDWTSLGADQYVIGVEPGADRLTVASFDERELAFGPYRNYFLTDFDRSTNTAIASPSAGVRYIAQPAARYGSRLRMLRFDRDPRGLSGNLYFVEHDVASGETSEWSEYFDSLITQSGDYDYLRWFSPDGGISFVSYGGSSEGKCLAWLKPNMSHIPSVTCSSAGSFPATSVQLLQQTSAGATVVSFVDGRVKATLLLGPDSVKTFDLGEGVQSPATAWNSMHERFGHLIGTMGLDGKRHFFDITPDQVAEEVLIPATPCDDDDDCGTDNGVAWVLPLDGNEMMAFWVVNIAPEPGIEQVIIAARVTPERKPVVATAANDFELAHPDAFEAGEFEKRCVQVTGTCWPGVSFQQCFDRFRSYPMVRSGPVQQLLSSGTDCSIWSEPAVYQTQCSTTGYCLGNAELVTQCAGTIRRAEDCSLHGQQCNTLANGLKGCAVASTAEACGTCNASGDAIRCEGGGVIQEHCATEYGLVCANGQCMDPCTNGSECVGSVATCSGGIGGRTDCSLLNMSCEVINGLASCVPPKPRLFPGCNVPSQCVNNILGFCVPNEGVKWVDCAALGFTSCNPTTAMCE